MNVMHVLHILHDRYRVLLLAVFFLFLHVGCQGTWEAYEEIEVGKPFPRDGLLAQQSKEDRICTQWVSLETYHLPQIWGMSVTSLYLDEKEIVLGKKYSAFAFGHWGVCTSIAGRSVWEFQVPPFAYHEPSGNPLEFINTTGRQPENVLEYLLWLELH